MKKNKITSILYNKKLIIINMRIYYQGEAGAYSNETSEKIKEHLNIKNIKTE